MTTAKIATSIEEDILIRLDLPVKSHTFPNRSKAIQEGEHSQKVGNIEHTALWAKTRNN
ncbi:MAG: hypothetical protein U9N60_04235 [Thermodesulfobacteriota bacterium]|nr:hypothetical protein [Thermodesulfobacteriota bacterium]